MKLTNMGRGTKALAVSLALGLGVSACSRDYTVAYLYVTSAKTTPGEISEFQIDYQLGSLVPLSGSPISAGGNDPVALVVSTNNSYTTNFSQYVYVLNQSSSTITEFAIGGNGTLTLANTYSIANGSVPTSIAMDNQDKFLYVAYKYGAGFSAATPGPGGIAVFPVNTSGALGTQLTNIALGNNPVGIVASNSYCVASTTVPSGATSCTTTTGSGGYDTIPGVFVVDQETVNSVARGVILAFQENQSTGALTAVKGSVLNGFAAGVTPAGIAVDPTGRFVYVTDQATNQIFGNLVTAGGVLSPMVDSPFATGTLPQGVIVDPRGSFVYVANFSSSTISGYAINTSTGTLSGNGATFATGTGPTCVTIEPALGKYLYSSNNLDNTVSGASLNVSTGALSAIQGTAYPTAAAPTCAAAAASGSHATTVIAP